MNKEIALQDLLEKESSLFKLTNMAASRAMELNAGMKKLVDADPNTKLTTIAFKEIKEGKINYKIKK